jgi:general secretion pathway protein A
MNQWAGYGPDNVLSPAAAAVPDGGPQSAISAGALTYEPYYGLKAKPFSLSTDPRTLYKSPSHASVLEDLLAGIRRREGLIVLTGEMGTGKTTLCRAALYQLDRKTFTTFAPDPFLSREDLLRMLLVDFGEVSVDDLRRGRLSGSSRPDLSYQLYEFLTSLESVDAFAVLVIDEAQNLAPPLLDEIRALSELEAGRRLLQIVLVGQPEFQQRLKHPEMRQIDQRVTMRCELRPLTREDVAGYVAHRLALTGGTRERVAFASAAIDMIHEASNGIPRLVNIICDRALTRGHHEGTSVIGPPLVSDAIEELQIMPVTSTASSPVGPSMRERQAVPVPPRQPSRFDPRGLFEKKPVPEPVPEPVPTPGAVRTELHDLLDLPATTQRRDWGAFPEDASASASTAPAWKWRVDSEARRGSRTSWLRNVGLGVFGIAVLLIAGGMAVTSQRARATAPAAPESRTLVAAGAVPVVMPQTVTPAAAAPRIDVPAPSVEKPAAAAVAPLPSQDTWVVQVAAFSHADRSAAMVQRLTQSGFPAFEVPSDAGERGILYFVRVGPFKTAAEADDARAKLRLLSDIEGAFVRSVTTQQ